MENGARQGAVFTSEARPKPVWERGNHMIILCVGDVVGGAGCQHLRRVLPVVKRQYGVDILSLIHI